MRARAADTGAGPTGELALWEGDLDAEGRMVRRPDPWVWPVHFWAAATISLQELLGVPAILSGIVGIDLDPDANGMAGRTLPGLIGDRLDIRRGTGLTGMRMNHIGVFQLALLVETDDLTACPKARVNRQDVLLPQRCG